MKKEFLIAILRTFLFSSSINSIRLNSWNELEALERAGFVFVESLSPLKLSIRLFLYGYCCSTWVKTAKLLGNRRTCQLLSQMCLPQKNRIGLVHLFVGSLLFQLSYGYQKSLSILSPEEGALRKVVKKSIMLTLFGLCFDEFIGLFCMYWFNKQIKVVGTSTTGACMICLQDETNQVISVCSANHFSHPDCITPWFNQGHGDCPMCRQKMNVAVDSVRNFDWLPSLYDNSFLIRVLVSCTSFSVMSVLYIFQMKLLQWRLLRKSAR
jgi:hypothetical protein